MKESQKASHVGAGIVAGVIVGVAASVFMHSKKGQQMTKQAEKKAKDLQKKLLQKLKSTEYLTKERYAEVVDQMMDFYAKGKHIASKEAPQIRTFLLKKWSEIERQLRSVAE